MIPKVEETNTTHQHAVLLLFFPTVKFRLNNYLTQHCTFCNEFAWCVVM